MFSSMYSCQVHCCAWNENDWLLFMCSLLSYPGSYEHCGLLPHVEQENYFLGVHIAVNRSVNSKVDSHEYMLYIYVCTQCLREACKSMFIIHTHRQLIMIIHWSWSEYVLLRSWAWVLVCVFILIFFILIPCKTLCSEMVECYQVSFELFLICYLHEFNFFNQLKIHFLNVVLGFHMSLI